jgi:hypothetical protein
MGLLRRRKRHGIHRYTKLIARTTTMKVNLLTHALVVTYAYKHNYTMFEATDRLLCIALMYELKREEAEAREKEAREAGTI